MSFWGELKQRKVVQVAAVYAVTAWLLIQIVVAVEAPLRLPDWFDTVVIVALAAGFPVALVLTWAFDLTPNGIQPADRGNAPLTRATSPATALTYVSHGLALLAVGYLVVNEFLVRADSAPSTGSVINELTRYRYAGALRRFWSRGLRA